MYTLFSFKRILNSRYISNSTLDLFQKFRLRSSYISSSVMATQSFVGDEENARKVENRNRCLFKFGVISDVQYGDIDDRLNFEGSTMRYYRGALKLLEGAVTFWKKTKPDFVVQLGDIVEGNHVKKLDREKTLKAVLDICSQLDCYVCHIWGNHEFYLYSRAELASSLLNSKVKLASSDKMDGITSQCNSHESLCTSSSTVISSNSNEKDTVLINNILHCYEGAEDCGGKYYFSFSPHPNFKVIVLDSYDISICGREKVEWQYEEARKILSVKNANDNWNSPFGLAEPHFVKFNGGISAGQLDWLHGELAASSSRGQHVIIISHIPLHPESTIFLCNIWNYQDLLDIIWSHSCVRACLCGHSHEAGDFVDHKGIQHIVFPAVLECGKNENAFADIFVYEDKMCITGHGKVMSYVINF